MFELFGMLFWFDDLGLLEEDTRVEMWWCGGKSDVICRDPYAIARDSYNSRHGYPHGCWIPKRRQKWAKVMKLDGGCCDGFSLNWIGSLVWIGG